MTENQLFVKDWLNRMYGASSAIESLERKRELVIGSMSGIGKYDAKSFPGNNGENASETKMIEYSELSRMIDKKRAELATEDMRTLAVIDSLEGDSAEKLKAILIDRYLNRMSWRDISKRNHYERSRIAEYHTMALDLLYDRVSKEVEEA